MKCIKTFSFFVIIFADCALGCAPKGNNSTSSIEPIPTFTFPNFWPAKESKNETVVETQSGAVDGYYMETISGKKVFVFQGIPYGEPTSGNNRFRDPLPKSPWKGIRQAKSPGNDCMQIGGQFLLVGHEDCLFLNVYSPKLPNSTHDPAIPVIIFIHGGFFFQGSGRNHGPYYLLSSPKDVILVTINYRLGVLGFLSTGYEGNYGLKDQALAIKWVYENIESFGGDPSKITLFGHSSGAASVHFHMLSPNSVAKDLFSAAIALSGSAFNTWALQNQTYAMKMTEKLSKLMNCPSDPRNEDLLNCLRTKNPNFLVEAQRWMWDTFLFPVVLFGPAIESKMNNNSFIDDTPKNYYEKKEVAEIPLIMTTTKDEADFFILVLFKTASLGLPLYRFKQYGHIFMDYRNGLKFSPAETNSLVLHHYFGTENILFKDFKILGAMGTDRYFYLGIHRALKYHSQVARTYSYYFGFTSPSGVAQQLLDDYKNWGTMHGEDMTMVLNITTPFSWLKKDNKTLLISAILVNYFTSFAHTGYPVLTSSIEESNITQWAPITDPENMSFLKIDDENLQMIADPLKDRISIWENLGIN